MKFLSIFLRLTSMVSEDLLLKWKLRQVVVKQMFRNLNIVRKLQKVWHPMSPTNRKILIHDPEIILYALIPISRLSEETEKAPNKDCTYFRNKFSQMLSLTNNNNGDYLTISNLRQLPLRKTKSFPGEILNALRAQNPRSWTTGKCYLFRKN